jgi:hypothetical protein
VLWLEDLRPVRVETFGAPEALLAALGTPR